MCQNGNGSVYLQYEHTVHSLLLDSLHIGINAIDGHVDSCVMHVRIMQCCVLHISIDARICSVVLNGRPINACKNKDQEGLYVLLLSKTPSHKM